MDPTHFIWNNNEIRKIKQYQSPKPFFLTDCRYITAHIIFCLEVRPN